MPRSLILLLAVVLLSGCVALIDEGDSTSADLDPTNETASSGVSSSWHPEAVPEGSEHAHVDPLHHRNLSTPNFEEVGWDPLITDHYNATSSSAYCAAQTSREDHEYVAFMGGGSDVAITIVDVTDPSQPHVAGELVLPRSPVIDVDFVDDTPYVAISTYGVNTADSPSESQTPIRSENDSGAPIWRDACGQRFQGTGPIPKGAGIVLVDLSDVTEPTVEDHVPQPIAGPHNVFADTVDGDPLVLSSVVNYAQAATYFNFYRVDDIPQLGPELVDVGTWNSQAAIDTDEGSPQTPPATNPHVDGWIQRHPLTNETIAYLANWNGGIVLLEYQGPHQLEQRAVWSDDFQPATPDTRFISPFLSDGQMTGQWHRAKPIEGTWNGSHYTVIHQEVTSRPAERPTGIVGILDTTDPANPVPVARWTLPVDPNWTDFKQYSPHYTAIQNQTIFVALGHAGVWALDASPENWPRIRSAGVFVPARETPAPPPDSISPREGPRPFLGDVEATEAAIVTADWNGVYTATFDPSMDVPEPEPWHAQPWEEIPETRR